MDKDLPRDDGMSYFYTSMGENWRGPSNFICKERPVDERGGIAAPAHLVRRLSTQERAARKAKQAKPGPVPQAVSDWAAKNILPEPRKPYDEKPLPVGIPKPPDGFCYVGMGVKKTASGLIYFREALSEWINNTSYCSGGTKKYHYAAPAKLCNRLLVQPQTVIAAEPKAELVKKIFAVAQGYLCEKRFDTIEQAYAEAEAMAKANTNSQIYVYELRAKFVGSVNVTKEVY